jgi:L-alanine-DL-glutamate epimerase-like enolase superfamily enzyme
MPATSERVQIQQIHSSVYTIPTDQPESDGTLEWNQTTLITAHVRAGGAEGFGYTYTSSGAARVIEQQLRSALVGMDALAIPDAWQRMRMAVRNLGESGIAFNAISAVDTALWDLKGKLLGLPVVELLGAARGSIAVYGSGGFTSYSEKQLCEQLGGWADQGLAFVKMKVGRDAAADVERVHAVRRRIGPSVQLFVDANGAYSRKQALAQAERFAEYDVRWFEEPVSSDDLAGLRLVRDRGPAAMNIAAGEYGYAPSYFRRMLDAEAVDVLQADVTRCGGITGFLGVSALVTARSLKLSGHCAPALHVHVACAAPNVSHLEYFHDHVRIEHMLFDGFPEPKNGRLAPDRSRPGLGLTLKQSDAQRFAANA